jgi:uncharacterized protein YegL
MPENWQTNWVDYYKILQVHLTAEPEVVKAAYERLARKYHPDVNDSPAALERMKELNEAYEILGNPEKRKRYHAEYLLKKNPASAAAALDSFPPKPAIDPPFVQFNDAQPGKRYRHTVVIRNKGGPYARLDIEHASPWLRIVRQTPASNSDRLPLEVEIEALGQSPDKKYVDNMIIKLDDVETHIKVELQTVPYRPLPPTADTNEELEPRFPCVLLLETSEYTKKSLLKELNAGLEIFKNGLTSNPLATKRVEMAILTFDSSVLILQGLVPVSEFKVPNLTLGRDSLMGTGVNKALDVIESRRLQYQSDGLEFFRPWVFMIATGGPKGEPAEKIEEAAKRIAQAESEDRIAFFAVGVNGADMEILKKISVRSPVRLADSNFSEMFNWVSLNLANICRSRPGEKTSLQPIDWGIF